MNLGTIFARVAAPPDGDNRDPRVVAAAALEAALDQAEVALADLEAANRAADRNEAWQSARRLPSILCGHLQFVTPRLFAALGLHPGPGFARCNLTESITRLSASIHSHQGDQS